MKIKTLCAAVLCGLVLVGCGKKGADKFNEVKLGGKATQADSVSYYIGEQMAMQRVQLAQNDTLLKTAEAQAKYDEGFYAGLEAMLGDDKAFKQGFSTGVGVAAQLLSESEAMGYKLSIDALASGYASAFDKNGKAVKNLEKNANEHQGKLMMLMNDMQAKAMKKQADEAIKKTAPAKKKLAAEAKKAGFTKVGNYYVKTVEAGNGIKLKAGDKIMATIGLADNKGNVVIPGNPIEQTVGSTSTYSPALDALQTKLDMNGHYQIMGSIDQLIAPDQAAQGIISGMVEPGMVYVLDYTIAPATSDAPAN